MVGVVDEGEDEVADVVVVEDTTDVAVVEDTTDATATTVAIARSAMDVMTMAAADAADATTTVAVVETTDAATVEAEEAEEDEEAEVKAVEDKVAAGTRVTSSAIAVINVGTTRETQSVLREGREHKAITCHS